MYPNIDATGGGGADWKASLPAALKDKVPKGATGVTKDGDVYIFTKDGEAMTGGKYNADGSVFTASAASASGTGRTGGTTGTGTTATGDLSTLLSGNGSYTTGGGDFTSSWTNGSFRIDENMFGAASNGMFAGILSTMFGGTNMVNWMQNVYNGFLNSLTFNFNTSSVSASTRTNGNNNEGASVDGGGSTTAADTSGQKPVSDFPSGGKITKPEGAEKYEIKYGITIFYDKDGKVIGRYNSAGAELETEETAAPAGNSPAGTNPSGSNPAGTRRSSGTSFEGWSKPSDTSKYSDCKNAMAVSDKVLSELGISISDVENKQKLANQLISHNPSVFDSKGNVKSNVNWSKLDIPSKDWVEKNILGKKSNSSTNSSQGTGRKMYSYDAYWDDWTKKGYKPKVQTSSDGSKIVTLNDDKHIGHSYKFDKSGRMTSKIEGSKTTTFEYKSNGFEYDSITLTDRSAKTETKTAYYSASKTDMNISYNDYRDKHNCSAGNDDLTLTYKEGKKTITAKFSKDKTHIVSLSETYSISDRIANENRQRRAAERGEDCARTAKSGISLHNRR